MRRFEFGVSAASQNLAAAILTLPNAPVTPSDGAELRAALDNFEIAFSSILSALHKTLQGEMLINSPPSAVTKGTTAYPHPSGYVVWLVGGLLCPHCSRKLRATDVDLDRHGGALICRGCHGDVARVERI